MQWADIIDNPWLQNLPFKIELNRWSKIEMSPASNQHGAVQVDTATELRRRRRGTVLVECSIQTTDGVRVAGVAWISSKRLKTLGWTTPFLQAPELCGNHVTGQHLGRDAHENRPVPVGRGQ